MEIQIKDSIIRIEENFGKFLKFNCENKGKSPISLNFYFLENKEINQYFKIDNIKYPKEYEENYDDFLKELHNVNGIYIWISDNGAYVGEGALLDRLTKHIKQKENIKKIWLFAEQKSFRLTADARKVLENKLIKDFNSKNISLLNKQVNNEEKLSIEGQLNTLIAFKNLMFYLINILNLDFFKEANKNAKKLQKQDKSNTNNIETSFEWKRKLIANFFQENNNLNLSFKYPNTKKQISIFVKNDKDFIIKSGSDILSMDSADFKQAHPNEQRKLTEKRIKWKVNNITKLTQDIEIKNSSLEIILDYLTIYQWKNTDPGWGWVCEEDYSRITDSNGIPLSELIKTWMSKK